MARFTAAAGFERDAGALPTEMRKNMEFFVVHLMKMIGDFTPDYEALKASGTRIIVGVGKESAGQPAHEAAVLAAGRLGVEPAYFPGDHGGFAAEAAAFAPLLREALGA
ncbi:hypothetical protein [Amycolatopsis orientalis]|uniref:hypothetical protein n=1 Tax=Amycolatopsis orientalis TaxID=31958 RepID=UPI000AF52BCB|nr:hypothetical protein [Amycolatopsis orientalis]